MKTYQWMLIFILALPLIVEATDMDTTIAVEQDPQVVVFGRYNGTYDRYDGQGSDGYSINCYLGLEYDYGLIYQFGNIFEKTTQTQRDNLNQQLSQLLSGENNWAVMLDVHTLHVYGTMTASAFHSGGSQGNHDFRDTAYKGNDTFEFEGNAYYVVDADNLSPIIIDMDQDGKPDVNRGVWGPHAPQFFKERAAMFDMSGDGLLDFIEWLGPKDGLLVRPEADGSVKNAHNLFGTAGGYKDGYEKMATVLDIDKNGCVEGDELNGLFVWQDLNGNTKVDAGEMKSVQDLGLEKISVNHKDYVSVCTMNGKETRTFDWWPTRLKVVPVKK